jgi:hypothetical protein
LLAGRRWLAMAVNSQLAFVCSLLLARGQPLRQVPSP